MHNLILIKKSIKNESEKLEKAQIVLLLLP